MGWKMMVVIVVLVIAAEVQDSHQFFFKKRGCPKKKGLICNNLCLTASHCLDGGSCCKNACGTKSCVTSRGRPKGSMYNLRTTSLPEKKVTKTTTTIKQKLI
ncbi:hypothetical protein R5R35_010408 [Gryllus longicercus]|uniref:WAP domain-containing protein n=1 Tax=Gryllus longicercus TaxID=2509291 RepID=A0AAN9VKF6_9ORTH